MPMIRYMSYVSCFFFFFSSRRRHTRYWRDWSSDVCSSDLPDHPDRLASDRRGVLAGVLGAGLALEGAGGAGEEGDVVDGAGDVEALGEPDRLAGLPALRRRELTGDGVELGGQPVHRRRSLGGRRARPAGERGLRRGHGLVDVLDRGESVGGDDVAVGGVGDRQGVGRAPAAASAVDELLARVVDWGGRGGGRGGGHGAPRSEERRVGKECRSRWSPY